VYQTFPDKSPKKLNEQTIRSLIGETATRKFPDSPLRRGDQLKYGQLKNLQDNTKIWVHYQNPETEELVINEPMILKRSYTRGTKQDPVWRLTSTKDKGCFEYFEQPESRRNDHAHCVDEDKMSLFTAQ
jgi:hypothetical protein